MPPPPRHGGMGAGKLHHFVFFTKWCSKPLSRSGILSYILFVGLDLSLSKHETKNDVYGNVLRFDLLIRSQRQVLGPPSSYIMCPYQTINYLLLQSVSATILRHEYLLKELLLKARLPLCNYKFFIAKILWNLQKKSRTKYKWQKALYPFYELLLFISHDCLLRRNRNSYGICLHLPAIFLFTSTLRISLYY